MSVSKVSVSKVSELNPTLGRNIDFNTTFLFGYFILRGHEK